MAIETTSDLSLVGTSQIVDGSVTSAKIGAGAVVAASIAAASVGSAAISAGSINSTHIGANAVVSGGIAAGAVDSAALASGSVVAASIAAGAVGSAALASNAVVAAKIAALSVGVVAISSGTSTSGTLLTADGAGGAAFSPAPPGGGMVLISSVSAFASASPTSNLSFIDIPQTYTRLHLIGQFYVTSAGEHTISINPSTNSAAIGGTTGFASRIEYINKTTSNGITTYGDGNNNFEGSAGSAFICVIPNQQSRWSMVNIEINNYRNIGPASRIGFLSQQHAGRFVGHGWGTASQDNGFPIRTLWVSGNFNIALFRLYGS
jgi:hypothetical protein